MFNYIKIQDKLGAKLFRQLLLALREIDDASTPMIDILNRLEKLNIIESVEQWDKLREIRNLITHEYPLDIDERLENIALALAGFEQLNQLYILVQLQFQLFIITNFWFLWFCHALNPLDTEPDRPLALSGRFR
ncbi:hypothetical protein [Thiomicrospira sp. ALE5]|uniref:hypothetical protein n=1 Tax=Thiomicrospira sp. ALE5 TaxID=748650 RepID=UPI00190EC25E|nr:hypothetical protein [Thiomicrospira sp. ALE5]